MFCVELTLTSPSEQIDFKELASLGLQYDPYTISNSDEIYFLSIMKTRLDKGVKRGALVKALAIGSTCKLMLEPLTKIIDSTLN